MTALTAEFTTEVERLATVAAQSFGSADGDGLELVETAVRAAMTTLG